MPAPKKIAAKLPKLPVKSAALPPLPPTAAKTATAKIAKTGPKNAGSGTAASTKSILRKIFEGAGFQHIHADDLHFIIGGRKGEIDHIFVWENVVVLCEETTESHPSGHCTNKIYLHRKIAENYSAFHAVYDPINPAFRAGIDPIYKYQDLEIRHVYFSEKADVPPLGDTTPVSIMTRAQAQYFSSLVETIERSAKFELLKYLDVKLHQTGSSRRSGSGVTFHSFDAFALPAAHTSYPPGFAVVSFYADPMALITRSYVMRRDGWQDPNLSYQRFVRSEKLFTMREYLAGNGKVFVNNLVVTLPSTALLRDSKDNTPVTPATLTAKTSVQLYLPLELGTIGIVDGQHRILSYYEGSGENEAAILQLRDRQNLLVTGIVFPNDFTAEMRVKFEAEIFLGINNNQSAVHTQLRQDLLTIINPETPLAIARSVISRLSIEGPLGGMMAMSQFDPSDKISSGSLGPYVVQTLTKPKSAFYKTWDSSGVKDLSVPADRQEFVDYCVEQLKWLLGGAAAQLKSKWKSVPNGGVLSTTAVGGLLLLADRLAKNGQLRSSVAAYSTLFKNIAQFKFETYTGSSWGKLATTLYDEL